MIVVKDTDRVRTITINRPDKANSLTEIMLVNLIAAFEGADANVIVLTGEGHVFSAGADLKAAKAGLATSSLWEQLSAAVAAQSALTIAALNGTVAGGAMGMVLACDLRVAVASASFFYPVLERGFLPQPSDPVRMTALVGPATTKRILLGGETLSAKDALRTGLVDSVVSMEKLLERTHEMTAIAQKADPSRIAAIKAMI